MIIRVSAHLACLTLWLTVACGAQAVNISFDYSRDTNGFFGPATLARQSLEAAGDYFEGILADDLDPLSPGGVNTWTATFDNPQTGASDSEVDMFVPADTLIVLVGARDLSGGTLGLAGPGGLSASGTSAWIETIKHRGETNAFGAGATDFAPWGGQITIDTTDGAVARDWNDDHTASPSGGQADLYSVLLHELGHVLGYGTSTSWDTNVALGSPSVFSGSLSSLSHGGSINLHTDDGHWAIGTMSSVGGMAQEAAMDPNITLGTRKHFTDLDVAGLGDLGWTIVPEPSSFVLAAIGLIAWGWLAVRRAPAPAQCR